MHHLLGTKKENAALLAETLTTLKELVLVPLQLQFRGQMWVSQVKKIKT